MDLEGRITVYSIGGCPSCIRAKYALSERGLPFTDVDVGKFPQVKEYLIRRSGILKLPQIFFNSKHLGGYAELQKALADSERFENLINEVRNNAIGEKAPPVPDEKDKVQTVEFELQCDPDKYAIMVLDLKDTGLIKSHRSLFKTYSHTFKGTDFVRWLMERKEIDQDSAVENGQILIENYFIRPLKGTDKFENTSGLYRLLEDEKSTALNSGMTSLCKTQPVSVIGEEVRRLILEIYTSFLSADGTKLDYVGVAMSEQYQVYQRLTQELVRLKIEDATKNVKLAFFINIYNALVIHSHIENGAPTNKWQIYKLLNRAKYIIGGHPYSLYDIENGVLRGNKKGVGMIMKQFKNGDPRLKVALDEAEPLIHFALVCGAKSCPPIKIYTAQNVMKQLKLAGQAFLDGDDGIQIDSSRREIKLSRIIKWYKSDFGNSTHEVLKTILRMLGTGEKYYRLKELLKGMKYKVSYMKYDWSQNSVNIQGQKHRS